MSSVDGHSQTGSSLSDCAERATRRIGVSFFLRRARSAAHDIEPTLNPSSDENTAAQRSKSRLVRVQARNVGALASVERASASGATRMMREGVFVSWFCAVPSFFSLSLFSGVGDHSKLASNSGWLLL